MTTGDNCKMQIYNDYLRNIVFRNDDVDDLSEAQLNELFMFKTVKLDYHIAQHKRLKVQHMQLIRLVMHNQKEKYGRQ